MARVSLAAWCGSTAPDALRRWIGLWQTASSGSALLPTASFPDRPSKRYELADTGENAAAMFEPIKGKIRKLGTGCVTQLNEHLWEGRFSPKWPDGKKQSRTTDSTSRIPCPQTGGRFFLSVVSYAVRRKKGLAVR